MEQVFKIAGFIFDSFIHIWPYLVITIPIAVAVQLSGGAKFINKALSKNPIMSVILATIVGAFSPFCSCGVIPVIASLLLGGVPIGPVMSFWIASPSMDPEIFFLSTATIGWELSIWRLVATFAISLFSGYITHFAFQKGVLGKEICKGNHAFSRQSESEKPCGCTVSFPKKLLNETWKASVMVTKFMTLAFFINALILFYVPQDFIPKLLSGNSFFSVLIAAVIGVPVYTSNITALPLISGLLALGMNQGAALAFLISGPITTLPAMAAVWGIVRGKIFLLYISFALLGAIIFGLLFNFIN
jgi:uncharacterized membrane protein YraQ (UPF0718 family)